MSAPSSVPSQGGKRKRSSSEKGPSKRARSESSESSDEEDSQAQIILLADEILKSKKNYNSISKLIQILRAEGEEADDAVVAAISLCRVFTSLMVSGDMVKKQGTIEKDAVVIKWLKERYLEYKSGLLSLLGEEGLSSTVLDLCMRLLKTEGQHLRGLEYSFPTAFLTDMVRVFLDPESDEIVREEFSKKYVEEYDDIRFYTLEALDKLLQEIESQTFFNNAVQILTTIESVPDSKEELEDFWISKPKKTTHALYSLTQHKKRAQNAWLALMKLDMDKEQRKTILGLMAKSIAPWFMKPELLMDFLTDSYNSGGSTSLLALSGVFYLLQEKNLDYPEFYRKLYSLLNSEILHSKHRSRFFRLLETFLGSTHLPAVLVASFLKRLSRLALNAPPAAVVMVIPWMYNILKKHPMCTFMIHRVTRGEDAITRLEKEGMDDPFLMDEKDPMETKAIDSSLWEIVMLQSHYHPNVATLAKIISEQFTKQSYSMEDFLDHSYGSMLDAEYVKDVKKTPVIEFEIPKKIFMKQDATSEAHDRLLVSLWDFS
ncbi:probable NOC4 Nucleolar protein, forms a complex with Nop14p that mediates maturation and nuclear export of 40S ribosomal subunits [Rhynchosporium agropyri]|uniref:Probable NOC4 Nucleolar protein, forms a complex with Nop14p that mediates maturation and nuclear export of 40S ribosomal subunits n=1 Tax=Rhynchosporium agropyri TaxID=914238 RepID=A0A1E1KQU2_9HELO|nr:probable NOC4 Nucleolar protein, forms a complex with Nop14p that mediates maturation and nuclear export of 40S ribosomal subunits [Rhynchosporium agropyri]